MAILCFLFLFTAQLPGLSHGVLEDYILIVEGLRQPKW